MSRRFAFFAGSALLALVAAVTAFAGGGTMGMGPSRSVSRPAFHGYYDGHKVT